MRRAVVATVLTVLGGGIAAAASAASASPGYPPPCPTQPLVWQSNGNYYVSLPVASGSSCRTVIEVPGTIKRPAAAGPVVPIPVPRPNGCTTEPILYEANGHDYLSVPDPSGQACRMNIELPVTVPPTL